MLLILKHTLSCSFLFVHDDSSSRNVFALQPDLLNHSSHIPKSHKALFQEFHVPSTPTPHPSQSYYYSFYVTAVFPP